MRNEIVCRYAVGLGPQDSLTSVQRPCWGVSGTFCPGKNSQDNSIYRDIANIEKDKHYGLFIRHIVHLSCAEFIFIFQSG